MALVLVVSVASVVFHRHDPQTPRAGHRVYRRHARAASKVQGYGPPLNELRARAEVIFAKLASNLTGAGGVTRALTLRLVEGTHGESVTVEPRISVRQPAPANLQPAGAVGASAMTAH